MKAYGNGTPEECANNLLRLVMGEVPFDRLRGIDPRLIDKPASSVASGIRSGADWLMESYEPRIRLKGVNITDSGVGGGMLTITAKFEER